MPLFGNTFSPKKTPPRKCASLSSLHTLDRSLREVELGLECGPPVMKIEGQSWKFDGGHWTTESGGTVSNKEMQRLKKKNEQLQEENNLLKLKIEILMDMLTEMAVDYHTMENEVEEIKNQHRRNK
ncbi:protein chibby homolog 1 [Thalassophryne amazonica]|uniref:protein chibby homolog 1 n=1 Tax=Thalassophryne amazonica TaxID=390379 RepID=UPI0014726148|nr:protein chibby homolog 1 [Thalassophryne amazonica]